MATDTDSYVDPFAERLAAQRALLAQVQPQLTPEQQAAVLARNYETDKQYKLGMLASLSGGEGLQQLGGTMVKGALAQRAPHVTERGVYDPQTGQFTLNPEMQREQHRAELARLEDRSAAARLQDQQRRQAAQERADAAATQRTFQEQQAALTRAAMAANRGEARAAAQEVRAATIEDRMADDFSRDTKTQQQVLNAHKNLAAIAQKGSAASDIALVYAYMKMQDPNSVVKESEFATAQNAGGVDDRIRNLFNKLRTGGFLTAEQRADMLETAGRLGAEAQSQIASTAEQYAAKAQRRTVNPENVTGRPYTPQVFKHTLGGGGRQPQQPQKAPAAGWSITKE